MVCGFTQKIERNNLPTFMDCTDLASAMILQRGLTFNSEPWSQFILTFIFFAIDHPTNLLTKDVFFFCLKVEAWGRVWIYPQT